MNNKYFISLGPDCHIAGALNFMKLRKQSLPFDFLLSHSTKGLKYVYKLIDNKFTDFLNDLEYNNKNRVISKNYPDTQFYHHDLIKNKQKLVKSLKIDHINMEEFLIEKFKRRGRRFINIIENDKNKCMFFYIISFNDIDNDIRFKEITTNINNFVNVLNNKGNCKYILIIFIKTNKKELVKINDKITFINNKYDEVKLEPFFGKNINEDNVFNITNCINKYNL